MCLLQGTAWNSCRADELCPFRLPLTLFSPEAEDIEEALHKTGRAQEKEISSRRARNPEAEALSPLCLLSAILILAARAQCTGNSKEIAFGMLE